MEGKRGGVGRKKGRGREKEGEGWEGKVRGLEE
jgi:hypothetical protein